MDAAAAGSPGVNRTVLSGALLLAVPVAVLGGLVSFFSPCVLPLVPGYLSYVTGLVGSGARPVAVAVPAGQGSGGTAVAVRTDDERSPRGRMVLGGRRATRSRRVGRW